MKKIILIMTLFVLTSIVYSQSSDSLIAKTDTVSYATSDTVSRLGAYPKANLLLVFPQYYSGYFYSDSTLEVSTSPTFTDGITFTTIAGQPTFLGYWNTASHKNWYFRKSTSSAGTITYTIIFKGR